MQHTQPARRHVSGRRSQPHLGQWRVERSLQLASVLRRDGAGERWEAQGKDSDQTYLLIAKQKCDVARPSRG